MHLLKLAMLTSLSYSNSLTIEIGDLLSALKILELTEPTMEQALRGVGRNVLSPITQDILNQIKTAPGGKIELGILLRMNVYRTNHNEFSEVIKTLITTGQVVNEIDTATNKQWLKIKEIPKLT